MVLKVTYSSPDNNRNLNERDIAGRKVWSGKKAKQMTTKLDEQSNDR